MVAFLSQAAIDASKVPLPAMAKALKDDLPPKKPPQAWMDEMSAYLDELMDAIGWGSIPGNVVSEITASGLEGARIGISDMKIKYESLIQAVNEAARDYAHDRAAELIGKKWVDGVLVDNPNAQWAITDTTRDMLRTIIEDAFNGEITMAEVQETIRNSTAFSEDRAELIARTEVNMAQTRSNFEGWIRGGSVLSVRWLLSADHVDMDLCDLNAAVPSMPIGQAFPSGHMHSPGHPRCCCVTAIGTVKGVNL
jgi:hypothetical protein